MKRYLIGENIFSWEEEGYVLKEDLFMKQFTLKTTAEDADYIFKSVKEDVEAIAKEGHIIQRNGLYELYQMDRGKFIVYHWARCRFAFGFWIEELEKEGPMTYYFSPDMENEIPLDAVRFFSCSGIHSKLLEDEAVIFHTAYVDNCGEAVLFCGKSGAGKSTQASLWEKYQKAEIINGDRALLKKKNDRWHSYGFPCCGSSAICKNRTLPVKAIVVLEHGKENKIEQMSIAEKIKTIIAGSERYLWSSRELDKICAVAEQLTYEVPMYRLKCKPDNSAVEILKNELEKI